MNFFRLRVTIHVFQGKALIILYIYSTRRTTALQQQKL